MRVLVARNVHQALPLGLRLLAQEGIERDSRNGRVRVAPFPVTTVYERPCERVLFWWKRDANPFFHLYESLWMLSGRNDVAGPVKYAKNMANFSDDGRTFHGAYGYRWRVGFGPMDMHSDQLEKIANQLRHDPIDRRCVLQMWDTVNDLGGTGKDLPCNLIATFQRDSEGKLDLTVFCRSNDIIWGAYGANAVHFSFLLEYMALWIGCPVGTYRQVSVNWHGYLATLLPDSFWEEAIDRIDFIEDPYTKGLVHSTPMGPTHENIDQEISEILQRADTDDLINRGGSFKRFSSWGRMAWLVLEAHEHYRRKDRSKEWRCTTALETLAQADQKDDWVRAASEWIQRRAVQAANRLPV